MRSFRPNGAGKSLAALSLCLGLAACETFFGESEAPPLPGERIAILETGRTVSPHEELAGVPVQLPPAEMRPGWPQASGSADNAGGHVALNTGPTLLWETSTAVGARDEARRPLTPPVVANGRVFVLDAVLNARAYAADSGTELWAVGTAPPGEHDGFGGGLATDGERVFVAGGHGQAMALDAETGRLYWRADLPGPVRGAPTLRGGRLFIVTADNRLVALNAQSGEELWDVPGGAEEAGLLGGAAPAASDDAVVAALSTGEVVAVRAANGRELWRNSLAALRRFDFGAKLSDIGGQPVLAGDAVYAASASGRAAAFALRTGNRIWERRVGSTETPWIAGNWLFLVTTEAELAAMDRRQGLVRWVKALQRFEDPEERSGEYRYAGPVLAGENLVLIRSDGQIRFHSPETGEAVLGIDTGDETILPPVVADTTLYSLSNDGTLRAFR